MPETGDNQLPASVVGMILDSLKRVEESVTRLTVDMHEQMSRLPELYVPRREVERRFDEHTIDIGELRSQLAEKRIKHDGDVERLEALIDASEIQRRADRRWVFGAACTVVALLLTVTTIVLQANGAK